MGRERPGSLDDLATVIFSSGSTGEPKGVMLTHYNIASNVEQLGQSLDFGPQDRFLGILPFFHSFGFTATLTAPAVMGIGVAYHPNPLDGKPIGELVRRYALTYLMATPTFLQIYLRSCEAGGFREPALCHGQRRETAGVAGERVRGEVRHSADGRLRLHGMLAGGDVHTPRLPRRRVPAGG